MAQNLQQRVIAAKKPHARVSDNEALLVDLQTEIERLGNARDSAAGESIDFALSDDDRDEAAAKAARIDRTIKALETEIAEVAAYTERRKGDDARKAAEAESRAALTERDEIAAKFADRVPAMMNELTALLIEVKANAERMKRAAVYEADAELIARGIPATGYLQMTPVARFTDMKIPTFEGLGRAWPVDTWNAIVASGVAMTDASFAAQRAQTQKQRKAKAEAAAKYAADHGTYRIEVEVSVEESGSVVRIPDELVGGNIPAAMGPWDKKQLVLRHEVAAQLGAVPRFKVTRLDKGAAQ